MAKASSPIRLDRELMAEASLTASTLHRSATEQIEHWADIGRRVCKLVDPTVLLEVQAGLATLHVEKTQSVAIDPNAVFAQLDKERESGELGKAIANDSVRYQASHRAPGKLEAVHPDGFVEVGEFLNGVFIADQIA